MSTRKEVTDAHCCVILAYASIPRRRFRFGATDPGFDAPGAVAVYQLIAIFSSILFGV